jgi:hypothetical protein
MNLRSTVVIIGITQRKVSHTNKRSPEQQWRDLGLRVVAGTSFNPDPGDKTCQPYLPDLGLLLTKEAADQFIFANGDYFPAIRNRSVTQFWHELGKTVILLPPLSIIFAGSAYNALTGYKKVAPVCIVLTRQTVGDITTTLRPTQPPLQLQSPAASDPLVMMNRALHDLPGKSVIYRSCLFHKSMPNGATTESRTNNAPEDSSLFARSVSETCSTLPKENSTHYSRIERLLYSPTPHIECVCEMDGHLLHHTFLWQGFCEAVHYFSQNHCPLQAVTAGIRAIATLIESSPSGPATLRQFSLSKSEPAIVSSALAHVARETSPSSAERRLQILILFVYLLAARSHFIVRLYNYLVASAQDAYELSLLARIKQAANGTA